MLTTKIQDAFAYAAVAHAGQCRKGTQIPYLSHLMAVASLVMEAAADGDGDLPEDYEDLVIAGLLHDVVEDCGGPARLADVRARFGDRVGDIVEHCTDAMPAPGDWKGAVEALLGSASRWAGVSSFVAAWVAQNHGANLNNSNACPSEIRPNKRHKRS